MSVIGIIHASDGVHLLSDGGLFNRGVVERITNKARTFPHLRAAISFRSSFGWFPLVVEQIGYSFDSFDHLVEGAATFFRDGVQGLASGRLFHGEELWFCGCSDERERFEAYGISSHGLRPEVHGVASDPWVLTMMEGDVVVPLDPTFHQRLATHTVNSVEDLGIAIAECQRQIIWANAYGDSEILVGAHIQLTTITKDTISQMILKSWPDKGVKVSYFDSSEPVSALSADTGSGGMKGLVPAPSSGDAAAGKFLKADGTWVTPAFAGAFGQCRLVKSGANLVLQARYGNKLTINGVNQTVPSAGVSLPPSGLTPSTLYYIYAYMNSGTMTLEASTTGHVTSTSDGTEIKSGDATRALVGMAYVVTGPAFADTATQRLVISWFNPRLITGTGSFTAIRTTPSTNYTEINTEIRVQFISRGDTDIVFGANGGTYNSGAFQTLTSIGIDSTTSPRDVVSFGSGANSQSMGLTHSETLPEGFHYVTILGRVSGGTGNWYTNTANNGERFTLKVMLQG